MQVSRLELFGFKSFMDRLQLPLSPGITGVVGPNGCGKSNVVDATRWVLGETRARSLRGGLLEDVIFNGTDKLRPLGLAEVTITLRASEKDFFADLVSPALEAELLAMTEEERAEEEEAAAEEGAAAGELLQEEQEPRGAEEAQAPAEENGGGPPQLIVIEGGGAAAAGPVDLVSGNGVQPPAEAHPSVTLLQKFSWLKSVSEVQVTRRLYRSGESEFFINRVPCRLRDLRELFRAVGLGPRAYTIVAQGEVSRVVTAKPDERRMILEEAAGVQGFRDKIAAAKRRLEDTDLNLKRLDDVIKEVSRQVNSLRRQAARAKNRQHLKEELSRLERMIYGDKLAGIYQELERLDGEQAALAGSEAELAKTLQEQLAREQEARGDLMSLEVAGDELRVRMDQIKDELNARERRRGKRLARVGELKAAILGQENELRGLGERKETLERRRVQSEKEAGELREKETELARKISELDAGSADDQRRLTEELSRLREQLRARDVELRRLRDQFISAKSALESVHEQLATVAPAAQLKKIRHSDQGPLAEIAREAALFVEGLKVPPEHAKAVQAVLRERAAFLISGDPYAVARRLEELRREGETFAIGVLKRGGCGEGRAAANVPFPAVLDVVEVQSDFALAARDLLDDVYLAPSLEEACRYFETAGPSERSVLLVTPRGQLVTRSSFTELHNEAGIVQLRNRAIELEQRCADYEQQCVQAENGRREVSQTIEAREVDYARAREEQQKRQSIARELGNNLGNVRGRLEAQRRGARQVVNDIEDVGRRSARLTERIEQLRCELRQVEEELAADVPDNDGELREELRQRAVEYESLEAQRRERRERLGQISRQAEAARRAVDDLRARVSSVTLERQKRVLARDSVKEKISGEYGTDLCAAIEAECRQGERLQPQVRAAYEEEVGRVRLRILREGDVDPESIEQLEVEKARLDDLLKQHADLEKASRILKRTIARLVETSVDRFRRTFEAVRENYSRLIPRLFGGGKGTLELDDPANPLESGLEIVVRPPGKKLKSIELLSGGEKALCATALIFAMFLQRPSPLCILDEVDAPLDDANLERFLALIKEISARTQFIMITHNKSSMAACDNIVGVTMEEPGASKMISVSLQEAYSQVA